MDQSNDSFLAKTNLSFEDLKKHNQHGIEYWSARDLQPCLGYSHWRDFKNAIKKAMDSCKQSGNDSGHHFAGVRNPITSGKGRIQMVEDYHLSRFACYLIAQNGDPRKPEIAQAQKYFAIQTRRQEISDQMATDMERVEMRKQVKEDFQELSGAARKAGVQNSMFGIFHDAGYRGLYGGLGVDAIKARKDIPPKDNLMDRMDRTELAANQFRMTQTQDKLKRDNIKNQKDAIETHEMIGKGVRSLIEEFGGTLPENIPPAEHIKKVENRLKKAKPRLTLEPKDELGIGNQ